MMSQPVLFEQREDVAILTLNAPKTRNALARELQLELVRLLEECYGNGSIRAIVLTGAGEHFCSGGDINNMVAERTLVDAREAVARGGRIARAMVNGPKPIVAAVEGWAAGAGFSLAIASDYVVASSASNYICAFGKVGILPDIAMLWSLSQRIGMGEAKRTIASCRKVKAEEALQLGMVDKLVEPGTALDAAMEIAREFTVAAPLATAMMKTAFARGMGSVEDALTFEADNQPALYLTKDHREAVAAFMEKRAPEFKGR
jgi:enoyl-CoA hydratase/carnithine racemase